MQKTIGFLAIIAAMALALSCQMTMPEIAAPYDFDEFSGMLVKTVSIDGETRYLIDGDIMASNIEEVRAYYEAYKADLAGDRSTVNVIIKNGQRYADIYSTTQRLNLTYTIDPTISASVKSDLVWALGQWEAVCGVKFKNVTGTSTVPLFKLRNATASEESQLPGVIASAFFPSYSKKELILFKDFYDLFSNGATFYGWDAKAVLIHELGHGIGLRHEFIWTKYSTGWRQTGETSSPAYLLTSARDDYSIMYYPQYSAYKGNGRISSNDIYGVQRLYPKN
jgi:hypothetical protein